MGNAAIRDYARAAETADLIGAVDTGSLVLAAGLLEGRQATTHWSYGKLLEKLGTRCIRVSRPLLVCPRLECAHWFDSL